MHLLRVCLDFGERRVEGVLPEVEVAEQLAPGVAERRRQFLRADDPVLPAVLVVARAERHALVEPRRILVLEVRENTQLEPADRAVGGHQSLDGRIEIVMDGSSRVRQLLPQSCCYQRDGAPVPECLVPDFVSDEGRGQPLKRVAEAVVVRQRIAPPALRQERPDMRRGNDLLAVLGLSLAGPGQQHLVNGLVPARSLSSPMIVMVSMAAACFGTSGRCSCICWGSVSAATRSAALTRRVLLEATRS